jgi:hypothetical protein
VTVAEKFQNYTKHLLHTARLGGRGEKVRLVLKLEWTSDNWLLSELRMAWFGWLGRWGVACLYRQFFLAV